jgi:hypothetical protein
VVEIVSTAQLGKNAQVRLQLQSLQIITHLLVTQVNIHAQPVKTVPMALELTTLVLAYTQDKDKLPRLALIEHALIQLHTTRLLIVINLKVFI